MVVVFGDTVATVANALRDALVTRSEAYADGVTVGTVTPIDREPHSGPTPLVVVTQDGPGEVQRRANNRSALRLSVWHHTDDDAFDLAMLAHGIALTIAGPIVRSVLPGVSPVRAVDPDTGEPMAWCTVTANAKPRNI